MSFQSALKFHLTLLTNSKLLFFFHTFFRKIKVVKLQPNDEPVVVKFEFNE